MAQILLGTLKCVAMEDQEFVNDGGLHVSALFRARLIKVTGGHVVFWGVVLSVEGQPIDFFMCKTRLIVLCTDDVIFFKENIRKNAHFRKNQRVRFPWKARRTRLN